MATYHIQAKTPLKEMASTVLGKFADQNADLITKISIGSNTHSCFFTLRKTGRKARLDLQRRLSAWLPERFSMEPAPCSGGADGSKEAIDAADERMILRKSRSVWAAIEDSEFKAPKGNAQLFAFLRKATQKMQSRVAEAQP